MSAAKAEEEGKLKANTKDLAFIQRGFSNWKDATERFRRHEQSKCHQDAVQVVVILPKSCADIGKSLSMAHTKQKAESRRIFLKILQNVKFWPGKASHFVDTMMLRVLYAVIQAASMHWTIQSLVLGWSEMATNT